MARIRSIKPDIRRSRTVCSWPYVVRWTFAGLPGYLDDEGRGLDDVRLIKAELYPLDDDITPRKLEQHLITIGTNGPLCRYEVDGERYLHVTSWTEHQRVNRPTPSRVPPCPIHEKDVRTHGGFTESSSQERKGKEQGKEKEVQTPSPAEPARLDVEQICTAVADHVEQVSKRRPSITEQWRTSARLLLDTDNRPLPVVLEVIAWVTKDQFWSGNILSVPTLRKQFDRLFIATGKSRPQQQRTLAPEHAWLENM